MKVFCILFFWIEFALLNFVVKKLFKVRLTSTNFVFLEISHGSLNSHLRERDTCEEESSCSEIPTLWENELFFRVSVLQVIKEKRVWPRSKVQQDELHIKYLKSSHEMACCFPSKLQELPLNFFAGFLNLSFL